MNLNIVLYQPEIPQNTGNIARTCVLTNSTLHLIKPLGFSLDEKHLKRAGLEYWKDLKLEIYESYEEFMEMNKGKRMFLASTHATEIYSDVEFQQGDFIMFGRESCGVPDNVHNDIQGIRTPMLETSTRSLNLSNTVAIVAYEALRQLGFPGMK